ncbi:endonuclease/exonuclease/phosphatase family protein [Rhizobium sp. NPDC090275]|uniref:endonuclease/exonuclease/phosphatase family protein n=1 Tax=Rhizobium sp. NPDC090275 TaxID=3364498 RepID=UPI003839FB45
MKSGSLSMSVSTETSHRTEDQELRILTYNVHSCIGTDRQLDPNRIADVIAQSGADIIALQELDVGRKRTGGIDQAHMIATLLKMEAHFNPALHVQEEKYGDAILTALPALRMKAGPLPSVGETRGAIWTQVDAGGRKLNVLNTHLGLRNIDRIKQVRTLLSDEWIGSPDFHATPSVICGDLNARPSSPAYRMLAGQFRDAQLSAAGRPRPTFPSRFPLLRIDHVFLSRELKVSAANVVSTPLTKRASDHLPLLITLKL